MDLNLKGLLILMNFFNTKNKTAYNLCRTNVKKKTVRIYGINVNKYLEFYLDC